MIHLTFVHNPLFINKIAKCNLIFIVKNCMIRLSLQLQSNNNFHDDVILTNALRSYICRKLTMADFPCDKYTFDCKYVSFIFCIE